ncbi:unnamed protein product [Linum trigynum]|uniref:Uncharacterized protein n=1 Tax=Linum trigynum TaxID=586398 RepID=A0AAV2DW39_9ROSI
MNKGGPMMIGLQPAMRWGEDDGNSLRFSLLESEMVMKAGCRERKCKRRGRLQLGAQLENWSWRAGWVFLWPGRWK